jgi:hypothetical protein
MMFRLDTRLSRVCKFLSTMHRVGESGGFALVAELTLDKAMLQDVLSKKW